MHQNLKIISVSLYATTLEIQDDLTLCIHHLLSEIQCFRSPHIYRLTAVLYKTILYVLNASFSFTERLIDDFSSKPNNLMGVFNQRHPTILTFLYNCRLIYMNTNRCICEILKNVIYPI